MVVYACWNTVRGNRKHVLMVSLLLCYLHTWQSHKLWPTILFSIVSTKLLSTTEAITVLFMASLETGNICIQFLEQSCALLLTNACFNLINVREGWSSRLVKSWERLLMVVTDVSTASVAVIFRVKPPLRPSKRQSLPSLMPYKSYTSRQKLGWKFAIHF